MKLFVTVAESRFAVNVIEYWPPFARTAPLIRTYPDSPSVLTVFEVKAAAGAEVSVNVGSWAQFGVFVIENVMSCG
jgi:hypothetical protein